MRSPSRPLLAALLAAPLALAATSARAQDPPAPPLPAQPLPAQPLPEQALPVPLPPPAPFPGTPVYPQAEPYLAPPPYYAPPIAPVPAAPDHEYVPPGSWYGWQTLIAVAPLDIAMFAGLAHISDPKGEGVFAAAFTARNLAPGIVHMAHGRVGTGFGSVGLHAAATATGVAIGYAFGLALQGACPPTSPCRNGFRDLPVGPGYGAIAGSMVGTVLDVVFFAHRTKLSWTAARPGPSWAMAPFAGRNTAGLSAGGMF
jgi:hypothetical protein